ncbi:MAG: hypothetical protein JF600_17820 [Xanthomonadales bacterium]|nr:hypothetical protein [Xanthomonadales bacterium]
MKIIQLAVGVLALAASAVQFYYLIGIGQWTTRMQPLTAILYILFFWILWGYARIDNFIPPLLSASHRLIKVISLTVVAISVLMVFFISQTSGATSNSMMKFGFLNGAIMACYFLVALVSLFGDKWLGFVARMLKMGREFPRDAAV